MGAVTALIGCERDPLDTPCPNAGVGDLVITEIRGDQSGEDTYQQWFELYNASAANIDLAGLTIAMKRIDGGAEAVILVRNALVVEPGKYVVIGRVDQGSEPSHINYGYLPAECTASTACPSGLEYGDSIYNAGSVEISSCGTSIDRVIVRDMPSTGTWMYDGANTPSAEGNDNESDWCTDDVDDMPDPTQLGIRGTPGEANRTCP